MATGFLNIDSTRNLINSTLLPNTAKDIINNPYYLYNDKTATIGTYYNLNTKMTTLDESTRDNYGDLSINSPLRFNKVIGFYLYGIAKIEPSLDINEYGLEGENIDGEVIILPNTVIPYPGDRFTIDYLGENYIFQITSVNPNTLDTGSVMYKCNYSLCGSDSLQIIDDKVVKTYRFNAENVGTNFNCLIEDIIYSELSEVNIVSKTLKDYFLQLFYDARVQTIAYYRSALGCKVHDPYMLEFIIRNKILDGASNYTFLDHQMYLPKSFGIDYDRTIFSSIENGNISKHIGTYVGNILLVTQKLSLLYAYPQDYYYMEYARITNRFHLINIFNDPDIDNKIINNIKTGNVLEDIIIGYFHNEDITAEQLEDILHIEYMDNDQLFYLMPMVIFILDQYINNKLSK